jgi:uncharacterized LabA/DUF88 family protein
VEESTAFGVENYVFVFMLSCTKGKRSKRVDITLASELLTHVHRRNMDIAVLVAGDEDYVPLVESVKSEGCRVVLWFFKEGLSTNLELAVDHAFNLSAWFLADTDEVHRHYDPHL